MTAFNVHIIAMDRDFYEGECEYINVPLPDGLYAVEAFHNDMIAAVVPGELTFRIPGEENQVIAVSSGLIKVEKNDVLVLVESAERPEEIDENRARRAEEDAKEELLQKKSYEEYQQAQLNLARAINRLKVKNHKVIK